MKKNESANFYRYWGKADKNNPTHYHLLPYHCLDVAAAGKVVEEFGRVHAS